MPADLRTFQQPQDVFGGVLNSQPDVPTDTGFALSQILETLKLEEGTLRVNFRSFVGDAAVLHETDVAAYLVTFPANCRVTLPSTLPNLGRIYLILRDNNPGLAEVVPATNETISAGTLVSLDDPFAAVGLIAGVGNWHVLFTYKTVTIT
jgi:hypothetical protein